MDRYKSANIVSILGIIGNLFLLVIKLIAGLITHSQAMISDASNSLSDIFSSLMTFIGNKISSKEPDEDHILGHGKAEYIFSLFISLSMIVLSLDLVYSSICSIFKKSSYNFSYVLFIVTGTTIIIKSSLYLYTHKISKKYNNLLIEANALDHRNDCFLALLNLIASIFGLFGITYVDGIVGTFIALWILITGIKILKESYDVLMDKALTEEGIEKINNIIKKYPEIVKINHLNTTPLGYKYQVSLSIFVDGNLSTFESHDIADRLEKELMQLPEVYLAIIHVNPIELNKKKKKAKN